MSGFICLSAFSRLLACVIPLKHPLPVPNRASRVVSSTSTIPWFLLMVRKLQFICWRISLKGKHRSATKSILFSCTFLQHQQPHTNNPSHELLCACIALTCLLNLLTHQWSTGAFQCTLLFYPESRMTPLFLGSFLWWLQNWQVPTAISCCMISLASEPQKHQPPHSNCKRQEFYLAQ